MTVFWNVAPCSLAEIDVLEVLAYETSVSFCYTTRSNIPEDRLLHTHSRENVKSHVTAIYSENYTKLINTFCVLNAELLY
jgi:hypothetical protein